MSASPDLVGQRFGKLTVIRLVREPGRKARWECYCECGRTTHATTHALTKRGCQSCKCGVGQNNRKHGHAKRVKQSPEYVSWCAMISRCTNPRNGRFDLYGGRGIRVCDRWRDSFEAFLADMGRRPPGMTLDRFPDTNGDYEPGNARWATRAEQNRNRRHTLDDRERAELYQLADRHVPTASIAAHFDMSTSRVRHLIRDHRRSVAG